MEMPVKFAKSYHPIATVDMPASHFTKPSPFYPIPFLCAMSDDGLQMQDVVTYLILYPPANNKAQKIRITPGLNLYR